MKTGNEQLKQALHRRDVSKDSKSFLSRKPSSSLNSSKDSIPHLHPKVSPSQLKPSDFHPLPPPPPQPQKKGFWNWRPFRSSAPPPPDTSQRFHVLFSLHVHSIENIPSPLDGLRLTVHWNRKEEGIQTMPSRVLHRVAEFDETLRQRCIVDGVRSANQSIRYEAKLFTLSVVALDVDELELGKHHIDLSRLLPEVDVNGDAGQDVRSWSACFDLSGMAKGSTLNVTFSYDLLHQETSEERDGTSKIIDGFHKESAANSRKHGSVEHTTLDEEEAALKGSFPRKKTGITPSGGKVLKEECKDSLEDWSDSQETWNSQAEVSGGEEELYEEAKFIDDLGTDLDDEVNLVAGEFLDMLDFGLGPGISNSDGEPDSPRGRLLKQFEHESLFGVRGVSGLDDHFPQSASKMNEVGHSFDGMQFSSIMEAAESELQKAEQAARSKSRAQELEDEETQALMHKWGLSEKSFLNSPPKAMSGVGNTVTGPHLNHPRPLGKGLGSVLYLEDGGSLRSMSPSQFSKGMASGSLAMQVSKPVVVPSTMGSSAVDILRHLASFGTETLAKQAMAAMPLEDITGKAIEEVAAMGKSTAQGKGMLFSEHGNRHHNTTFSGDRHTSTHLRSRDTVKNGSYDDYVSLEDLAPLAMQNIEALAVDGLKIQADVAEEDAPSYLDAAAWGIAEDSKRQGKDSIRWSHDVAGMRFQNLQSGGDLLSDVKDGGPLSMALTIEEWSKLDAGVLDDNANLSLSVLAAHNADWQLMNREDTKKAKKRGNMGNTLMIAMLVQLRDPLQNFEPVGAPMMALIQAERVMLPPKPRFGKNVSMRGNSEVDDEATPQKEEAPQFKLAGIHLSGLKVSDEEINAGKVNEVQKKGWGSQKQLQAGTRWLAAQGMTKTQKHALLKSKPVASPAQTKVKPGETLWSISTRVHGSGHKWRELAALNPHIRNPDVIFTNDTLRTR